MRARNVDFYTRVLGLRLTAKTVNQDDPTRLPPVLRRRAGAAREPTSRSSSTRTPSPGAPARGWCTGSCGASHRARRSTSGRSGSPGSRRRRPSARATRCCSPTPRVSTTSSSSAPCRDQPLVADHPEIPAEMALQGFEGARAYSANPERQRAGAARELMGAARRDDGALGAARRAARRLDRASTPRRRRPVARAPAPCTTSRGARPMPSSRRWLHSARRDRRAQQRHRRPQLLPLGLLPRAGRHPLRAGDRRARLHRRSAARASSARRIILPPWLEPRRAEIEARLTPLPDPRADRHAATP